MIDETRLKKLTDRAILHLEAGQDDVRVAPDELLALCEELRTRRIHVCASFEDLRRERDRDTWGYDG